MSPAESAQRPSPPRAGLALVLMAAAASFVAGLVRELAPGRYGPVLLPAAAHDLPPAAVPFQLGELAPAVPRKAPRRARADRLRSEAAPDRPVGAVSPPNDIADGPQNQPTAGVELEAEVAAAPGFSASDAIAQRPVERPEPPAPAADGQAFEPTTAPQAGPRLWSEPAP